MNIPPHDTRIELVACTDPHTNLRPGDQGTTGRYSELGGLSVKWDNGSSLSLLPDQGDAWRILPVSANSDHIERGWYEAYNANTNEWVDLRTLDDSALHWWERAADEAGDTATYNAVRRIRLAASQ